MTSDFYIAAHGQALPGVFILRQRKLAFFAPLGSYAYGAADNPVGLFATNAHTCEDLPSDATFEERVRHIEKTLHVKLFVYERGSHVRDVEFTGDGETGFLTGIFKLPVCAMSVIHQDIAEGSPLSRILRDAAIPPSSASPFALYKARNN